MEEEEGEAQMEEEDIADQDVNERLATADKYLERNESAQQGSSGSTSAEATARNESTGNKVGTRRTVEEQPKSKRRKRR